MTALYNTSSPFAIVARMAADAPVSPDRGNGEDTSPPPELKRAAPKRKVKAAEERPPLPDETEPAPELPKGKRTARDYDVSDIIADDSAEDEFSETVPTAIRITTRLPKARYIQAHPTFQMTVYTIKLDEEDQRPGRLDTFVLVKKFVPYVEEELEYRVTKMTVLLVVTLQGQAFFYMNPASTDLSNNTFNSSRRDVVAAATKNWIKVKTDMNARRYTWRKRASNLTAIDPSWPLDSLTEFQSRFFDSLGDALISDMDHPIFRRLRGETENDAIADRSGSGADAAK
jgi:hypothetical protein